MLEPLLIPTPRVPDAPSLDPRIPAWTEADLVNRVCPACTSPRYAAIVRRPDGLLVAQCQDCHLYYLPIVPAPAALSRFYDGYSTTHQRWHKGRGVSDARRAASRRRGGNGLLQAIARYRRLQGRRLLEIGCARGSFLLDADAAGAHVCGMEVDESARQFVNDLGVLCYSSLTDALAAGPYDIIVALNLIEHLTEPGAWFQRVSRALQPQGLLVVWTPNAAQADALGPGWIGFRVDLDHVNYFSMRTLTPMLLGSGLWPEAYWELSQAQVAGFREVEPQFISRMGRLLRHFRRAPDESWKMPPAGGSYTLCMFAGRAEHS